MSTIKEDTNEYSLLNYAKKINSSIKMQDLHSWELLDPHSLCSHVSWYINISIVSYIDIR